MVSNTIDNKGDKLFSTIYKNPTKETILVLHGGPGVPMDMMGAINQLKDSYQIITFEQRGTKNSPIKSNDYSMDAYIRDIESIAKFYNLTKFHLWGHSWGGLYAQIYAEKTPERIESLFLCSPSSGTNTEWKETEKEVMQFNKSKSEKGEWSKMGFNSLMGMMGSDDAYKRLFEIVVKNYNKGFESASKIEMNFDNIKAGPINKTRPQILKYPLLNKQEAPKYKITITYGVQDIYGPSKKHVINRYPTAYIHTIEKSGHLPWLHNPTEYNRILMSHYQ
ncbi:alpha/beta fold hydrolase [Pedobacter sp. MW01-1-1]|uniref:alpha/beta fold hydrolase n=1 Tax=Pedobacter sp. MW01-1-1 TaxID=3383027 RepID=UPI003FEEF240